MTQDVLVKALKTKSMNTKSRYKEITTNIYLVKIRSIFYTQLKKYTVRSNNYIIIKETNEFWQISYDLLEFLQCL